MKKQKKGRKFNRKKDQRQALMITMARSLILNKRIKTTEPKAKELSSFIEKRITKAKRGSASDRKELLKEFSGSIVKKMIEQIAPLYKNRPGGYTRIIKTGIRKSDSARTAIIELINEKKETHN